MEKIDEPVAGGASAAQEPAAKIQEPISVLYKDPNEAAKAIKDSYDYWTGKLTESSFALSLAVIGANWAVFGSVDRVLGNIWSELSISTVVVSLAVGLLGAWALGGALRKRAFYAEENPERWQREFDENTGKATPWPFTAMIDGLAALLRTTRTWLPVLGGIFFVLALFFQPAPRPNHPQSKEVANPPIMQPASPPKP